MEKKYKQSEEDYVKKIEPGLLSVQDVVSRFPVVISSTLQIMRYQDGGMVLNGISFKNKHNYGRNR